MIININGVPLESRHLAQSAVDNDIDLGSLLATIDNFHTQSDATREEKHQWGEDVIEHYFTLLGNKYGTNCDGQQ